MANNIGKVIQVAGPAVDVQFSGGHLPQIFHAVRITSEGYDTPNPIRLICEVQQHLGEGRVRTVAMEPTEGLVRGMPAEDLGEAISVPVGPQVLGRVLNVIGEPVDEYNFALDRLLRYHPDLVPAAGEIAADPAALPMGQVFMAYLLLMSTDAPDVPGAREAAASVTSMKPATRPARRSERSTR
jgi:hypothetical protein